MDYLVKRISAEEAKSYIHEHHYSHGSHKAPKPCYGLFDNDELIGVIMFATPCSENVRSSIFGYDYKDKVIELHRLHILDCTPKNAESYFISKSFDLLIKDKPEIRSVIAFSDPTEGHNGTIYKATNAIYYGKSSKAIFYLDETGRLRHPRQCGVNIKLSDALSMGWTQTKRMGKYRYLWLVGNKSDRKYWKKKLLVKELQYEG